MGNKDRAAPTPATKPQCGHPDQEHRFRSRETFAAAAEEVTNPMDECWPIRLLALCNVAYHADREAFLGFVGRAASAMTIVFGSASIAFLVGSPGTGIAAFLAVCVTIAGAANLVFAPAHAARDSRDLKRRYIDLVARIDNGEIDATTARRDFARIAADAPPTCEAARAVAFNATIKSIYSGEDLKDMTLFVPKSHAMTRFLLVRSGRIYQSGRERSEMN